MPNHDELTARRRYLVALGLVLLGACALRFGALGQECLWADEFHSLAPEPTLRAALAAAREQGVQYPYYAILWACTRVAGMSEAAFRFPSAVFGVLGVAAMAGFAAALFRGRRAAALLATALLALSPMHVWYSQEARPYALQVLVEVAALWALARGMQGDCGLNEVRSAECGARRNNQDAHEISPHSALRAPRLYVPHLLASAVLMVLALEVHNFSIFVWAAFALIYALAWRPWRMMSGRMAAAIALIMLGGWVHPALSILDRLGARSYLQGYLPKSYDWRVIIDVLRAQLLGPHWSPLPFWLQAAGIELGVLLLARGAWRLWRGRHENPLAFYLPVAGWVMTLAVPTAISLAGKPIIFYGQRYLVIALPFTAALLAGNLAGEVKTGWPHRPASIALAALFALFLALQCAYFPPYYLYRQKHTWDQAGAYVERQRHPGDTVYVYPAYNASLLARYMRDGSGVTGLAADRNAVGRALEEAQTKRVFFVSYSDLRPWLAALGLAGSAKAALFETHQEGQTLWVLEYAPAASPR